MYGLTDKEKLDFIIKKSKELGISSYEYGQNTSLSDLGARNILTGESINPRTKNLNIMLQYLETSQIGINLENNPEKISTLAEPAAQFLPKKTTEKVVPFYNIEIASSYISSFEDAAEFIEFYIDYKPLNDCTAYLPYFGDSMYPMFKSGSTLAVKQLSNFDVILWGEAHLIITNENTNSYKTVKCLHQHPDNSKIILRAVSPNHPGDIVINKEDILSLYIVKGKIKLSEL